MEKRTVLNQDTLVPIGVTVLIFLASMWLSSVHLGVVETKQDLGEYKISVDHRLQRIEDKIDRLIEKK